jgi:hypothetical protein
VSTNSGVSLANLLAVADTPSTGWPPSIGIGGRFASEWVAAFRRNQWPLYLGFRILIDENVIKAVKMAALEDDRKASHSRQSDW